MERRTFLTGIGGGGIATLGGTIDWFGNDGTVTEPEFADGNETETDSSGEPEETEEIDVTFELLDPEDVPKPGLPKISIDERAIVVHGTLEYVSSTCGTVDLAYAGYEESHGRVDLLVVAADDPEADERKCTDDIATTGYRVEATVDGEIDRVVVSEHDAFGTNSASVSTH